MTIRARDSCTVSSWARTSAWSRAFTKASRAAAATASTSFGSSRSVGSWTRTASGSSFVLDESDCALRTILGNDETVARRIDVVVELGQPEPDLKRRVLERERQLVAQIAR